MDGFSCGTVPRLHRTVFVKVIYSGNVLFSAAQLITDFKLRCVFLFRIYPKTFHTSFHKNVFVLFDKELLNQKMKH